MGCNALNRLKDAIPHDKQHHTALYCTVVYCTVHASAVTEGEVREWLTKRVVRFEESACRHCRM